MEELPAKLLTEHGETQKQMEVGDPEASNKIIS